MNDLVNRHPWLPYVLPFALFVGLTELQLHVAGGVAWIYPAKTALAGVLLLALWRWLRPEGDAYVLAAAGTGIVVLALWILLDGLYPLLGVHTAFDPFQALSPSRAYAWICVRLFGAVVIVPIVEEFFWRGFLIRWLIRSDFRGVALGTFTWYSFLATSVLFALEHDRWLAGLLAGVAYNLLYYRSRSLKACIVSHAVTNLGLGLYVVAAGQWQFW